MVVRMPQSREREREAPLKQPLIPGQADQGRQIDEKTITTIALLVQRGEITAAHGRALLGLKVEDQQQLDSETITKVALLIGQGKLTAEAGRAFLGITHEQSPQLKSVETSAQTSASIQLPVDIRGWKMLQDQSILTKDGARYFPLTLAAWAARASESAITKWIEKRTRFEGKTIKTHVSPTTNGVYVSEESVQRIANRFVKWPSGQPAGPIALGETDDRSGYLAMPDASRIVGVSSRTMWLWASQGKAPTEKPLDIIKCTTSDFFYIREKDAYELKSLVPRSGLQRGRRPHMALEP